MCLLDVQCKSGARWWRLFWVKAYLRLLFHYLLYFHLRMKIHQQKLTIITFLWNRERQMHIDWNPQHSIWFLLKKNTIRSFSYAFEGTQFKKIMKFSFTVKIVYFKFFSKSLIPVTFFRFFFFCMFFWLLWTVLQNTSFFWSIKNIVYCCLYSTFFNKHKCLVHTTFKMQSL